MIVGVSDHSGWAALVTAAADGTLVDRRRIRLLGEGLPRMPHHHQAQALPLDQALALIARVRESAEEHARLGLAALARAVPAPIRGIAMRECPPLPPEVAERLRNYRAQNVADTVMYRQALARAAGERGWAVHWYRTRTVLGAACAALGAEDLEPRFRQLRQSLGPPWGRDEKLALAAAIAAAGA